VDSGVRPEKLSILPEAVDVHFFDPAVHRPFRMEELPELFPDSLHCNAAGAALLVGGARRAAPPYVFFSQYKWEPRKGWDVLLQGWADAFPGPARGGQRGAGDDANASATPPPPSPPRSDVLLLMLVNLYLVDGVDASSRFNMTYMKLAANAMLSETMGLGLDDLAPLCFLAEEITDEQLARLFRSSDAFVLPTRGEGWCLPAMQAMSMALPAIVTGYGGQLEFMTNNDNSFHIAYKLVQPPQTFYYQFAAGMEWAEPSVADLTRLMQYVVAHPRAGATIGRRAREHICQHFSEEAVKTVLERKLLEVQRRIGPRRQEWRQRKRDKK
jgi:glycosyltransferase involved in cell wall biosynthesis